MTELQQINRYRCFDGWQETWQHHSTQTQTPMKFSVYLPPQAEKAPCPVLYWLSGLTCTEENFVLKAGAQRYASELGLVLVTCDTSPRGTDLPGEHDSWDFGSGAGFYVNATQQPWSDHYRMEAYVVDELPALIEAHFPVTSQRAIAGHSMGGHGALVLSLRYPERYVSASAFAPIAAPTLCPWGVKAFSQYLGDDSSLWAAYDAHLLIQDAEQQVPLRVDQGLADSFLQAQLMPEKLTQAAQLADYPLDYHAHADYDHSYFFIASLIGEHLNWHYQHLQKSG